MLHSYSKLSYKKLYQCDSWRDRLNLHSTLSGTTQSCGLRGIPSQSSATLIPAQAGLARVLNYAGTVRYSAYPWLEQRVRMRSGDGKQIAKRSQLLNPLTHGATLKQYLHAPVLQASVTGTLATVIYILLDIDYSYQFPE